MRSARPGASPPPRADAAARVANGPPRAGAGPIRLTVVVPSRGDETLLSRLLAALAAQTLPRDRWRVVLAFDGAVPPPAVADALARIHAEVVTLPVRRGPGAARNEGAARATGDYLAFTEDDCEPDATWLAAAVARLERDPDTDVLEGATLLPDGAAARRRDGDRLTWLPTNLFVRRTLYEAVGGYCERFFDAARGLYFREDSDFGFTLAARGARTVYEPSARVIHPREHGGWLDPIRWAQRYEMDPLLAARHPDSFRTQIEVARWGPLRLRRPFVRLCAAFAVAGLAALIAIVIGESGVAAFFATLALAAMLGVWGKWKFDPRKLPVVPFVPFVLLVALARGRSRAYAAGASVPPPSGSASAR